MRSLAFLVIVFAILYKSQGFPKGTGEKLESEYIVGGTDALHGEFPYQLSLQQIIAGNIIPFCGAFIIDENYALTAAHCVLSTDVTNLRLVAGDLVLTKNDTTEQVRQVVAKFLHEDYHRPSHLNDIALLKVYPAFEFNDYVGPVLLPTQGQVTNGSCVVSGWGRTSSEGLESDILQKVAVPVISEEICRKYYSNAQIADSMICAGVPEGGFDSCYGDSGGPLMCNEYAAGIVSWGFDCAQPEYPGVYTEVAFFVDWIEQNINSSINAINN
ncbi:UNVERIFIED_CONTAM: hypothetical protein RMT77_005042 [Armadillidium vulgare]